jgi:hypothetical protein
MQPPLHSRFIGNRSVVYAPALRHQETPDAGQTPGVRSLDPSNWEDPGETLDLFCMTNAKYR